jgi:hypothetical protein
MKEDTPQESWEKVSTDLEEAVANSLSEDLIKLIERDHVAQSKIDYSILDNQIYILQQLAKIGDERALKKLIELAKILSVQVGTLMKIKSNRSVNSDDCGNQSQKFKSQAQNRKNSSLEVLQAAATICNEATKNDDLFKRNLLEQIQKLPAPASPKRFESMIGELTLNTNHLSLVSQYCRGIIQGRLNSDINYEMSKHIKNSLSWPVLIRVSAYKSNQKLQSLLGKIPLGHNNSGLKLSKSVSNLKDLKEVKPSEFATILFIILEQNRTAGLIDYYINEFFTEEGISCLPDFQTLIKNLTENKTSSASKFFEDLQHYSHMTLITHELDDLSTDSVDKWVAAALQYLKYICGEELAALMKIDGIANKIRAKFGIGGVRSFIESGFKSILPNLLS